MARNFTGEIKTIRTRQIQKNGDIYILERQIQYDKEKKYTKVLSSKLIGKIPKGSEMMVPTRPKKPSGTNAEQKEDLTSAERPHVSMMDILEHIGAVSGIDDAVYASADRSTARIIISLARYLVATDGRPLSGIQIWQFSHPLPYKDIITEDMYHDLFVRIGMDESLQQGFFMYRLSEPTTADALAYGSAILSAGSDNWKEAWYGYDTEEDGPRTIQVLTLYSAETRQPIAFASRPGHFLDVISLRNAVNQLSVPGVNAAEVITDIGCYAESAIAELLQAGFGFITPAETSTNWIRSEIDRHREELDGIGTVCPFDPSIHGITVPVMHKFEKTQKCTDSKCGSEKEDAEKCTRRIYLSIYRSDFKQEADKAAFEEELSELKEQLENGIPFSLLLAPAQNKVLKYFERRTKGKKTILIPKDKEMQEAYKYHGFFVLVSNREQEPFECLRKYSRKEIIESFFEAGKQPADESRPYVRVADTQRGRMFVQFVALCYYEYLHGEIQKLMGSLGTNNGDPAHDAEEILKAEAELKSWLYDTPLYLQLQWFDVADNGTASPELRSLRWSAEILKRDALYLNKLGITTC